MTNDGDAAEGSSRRLGTEPLAKPLVGRVFLPEATRGRGNGRSAGGTQHS